MNTFINIAINPLLTLKAGHVQYALISINLELEVFPVNEKSHFLFAYDKVTWCNLNPGDLNIYLGLPIHFRNKL